MKKIIRYVMMIGVAMAVSCGEYLNIVPDNVATEESAFAMRNTALRYLFNCYAYLPQQGDFEANPALLGGDETIVAIPTDLYSNQANEQLGRGFQNVVDPYFNFWDGGGGSPSLYQGIRYCNSFIENIGRVRDMDEFEKRWWAAEAKFLKAYYHFYLCRMYGPIVMVRENLPISAGVDEVKVKREPVDACIDYIVQLLDEASVDLPETIRDVQNELGRATKPAALALKAKVLVYGASPLFNGNTQQAALRNNDGQQLFNSEYSVEKWQRAVEACKDAIELCHRLGYKLHYFQPNFDAVNVSDETRFQMNVRSSVTEKWNSETIWGNPNSSAIFGQTSGQPEVDPRYLSNTLILQYWAPTLKMAELFYTENGVPLSEDKTWDYSGRYGLRQATSSDRYRIKDGYTTAALHFDRESRFYANLGFDGGIWYGQGRFDDENTFWVEAKFGQVSGGNGGLSYSATGYFLKKIIHYENVIGEQTYSAKEYPWPVLRLADLYLLFAEASNEAHGPVDDAFHYLDLVRERAGLKGVKESWMTFSRNAAKFESKEGLREIIRQERLIELAFEGNRFWDLRRWKIAPDVLNDNVKGWDIGQEDAGLYYRPKTIFTQTFGLRDYFWPLSEGSIVVNRNLVQNLGW